MEPLLIAAWMIGTRLLLAVSIAIAIGRWIREDPAVAARFVVSTVLVVALGVLGVIVLLADGDAWMTVFFGLPAVSGAAAVLLSPRGEPASMRVGVGVMAVVLGSAMLVILGIEGVVCTLMASPLVFAMFFVGAAVGRVMRWGIDLGREARDHFRVRSVVAVALLLLLPGAKEIELRAGDRVRVEAVESTIRVAAPPDAVWAALEEIDAVHGPKPLLLRIGLPVPLRCEMEGDGVGARRTCFFDRGRIDEVVTVWDPPRRMELEITHWTLPGRHWLGYLDASYELREAAPGITEVTRVTTISSNLRPSWYWRPLEHVGVRSEHEYLLRHVKRSIEQ